MIQSSDSQMFNQMAVQYVKLSSLLLHSFLLLLSVQTAIFQPHHLQYHQRL
jgi:hypothetical protein